MKGWKERKRERKKGNCCYNRSSLFFSFSPLSSYLISKDLFFLFDLSFFFLPEQKNLYSDPSGSFTLDLFSGKILLTGLIHAMPCLYLRINCCICQTKLNLSTKLATSYTRENGKCTLSIENAHICRSWDPRSHSRKKQLLLPKRKCNWPHFFVTTVLGPPLSRPRNQTA